MWAYIIFQENLITDWMTEESGVDYLQCRNLLFYLQRPDQLSGPASLLDWIFLPQYEANHPFGFSAEECVEFYMLMAHHVIKHRDNFTFTLLIPIIYMKLYFIFILLPRNAV
jgi:hypothetical protein